MAKKILIALIAGMLSVATAFAQPPDTLWTRTYGGSAYDYGYSVQQTQDGGYIVAGYTESFGAGGKDVYLIKTDVQGDTLWIRTYGETATDVGYSAQQTSDGGYIVVGYTSSFGAPRGYDVYLVKADASGNELWYQTYGGIDNDYGDDVQQTQDGGYIIAGRTNSYGAGSYDVYLIKTDALGDTLWSQTYGGTDTDKGQSVQQTQDGGYIIAGYTNSFGAGGYDFYLIKTDASGTEEWTRSYGGSAADYGYSVQQTQDGGYIITGYTQSYGAGGKDFYLVKTDVQGNELWAQTFGGSATEEGHSVQQTQDGGYIIAGYTQSYGAGGMDFYLVKTDVQGNELWAQTFGGGGNDYGWSVQQTTDGGYIIMGYANSYGAGLYDVYLIRLEGEGQPPPDLSVTLTPHDPPIVIPAGGGSFLYDLDIENTTAEAIVADAWIEITPPGAPVIPYIVRPGVVFPANATISRTLTQNVPARAPAGTYVYACSVGEVMGAIIDFDQFTFEKLETGEGIVNDWNLSGWEEEFAPASAPAEFSLSSAYPNPFNPITTLTFTLPEGGMVELTVFNAAGQKVISLVNGWREAGIHKVTFDGSGLASGVYLARLEAGEFTTSGKMVLMK